MSGHTCFGVLLKHVLLNVYIGNINIKLETASESGLELLDGLQDTPEPIISQTVTQDF